MKTKNFKNYYVYTTGDGNEDGLMNGYTLAEAKDIADSTAAMLRSIGEDDTVYVLELGTANYVCSGKQLPE